MILEGLHVEGFGDLCDLRWQGIPPGLSVVLGANEAGKTTLLAFLRAMLFGFPRRGGRVNSYPPIRGGRHGGRLTLRHSSGDTIVLERFAGRRGGAVRLQRAGHPVDPATLPALLGGASHDLYANIFAFGLDELQTLESVSDASVQARLYSAGAGLGRIGLPDLERRLEAEQAALFKPRGTSPELNRALLRRGELDAEIARLEEQTRRFSAVQRAAIEERNRSRELGHALTRLERERARLRELQQVLADLVRVGVERDEAMDSTKILSERAAIERLLGRTDSWEASGTSLRGLQARMRAAEEELGRILADLPDGLSREAIERFAGYGPLRVAAEESARELVAIEQEERALGEAIARAASARPKPSSHAPGRRAALGLGVLAGCGALAALALLGPGDAAGTVLLLGLIGLLALGLVARWLLRLVQARSRAREAEEQATRRRLLGERRVACLAAWQRRLAADGLPTEVQPAGVPDLLSRLREARLEQDRLAEHAGRVEELVSFRREFEAEARRLEAALGSPAARDPGVICARLAETLHAAVAAEERRRLLESELARLEERCEALAAAPGKGSLGPGAPAERTVTLESVGAQLRELEAACQEASRAQSQADRDAGRLEAESDALKRLDEQAAGLRAERRSQAAQVGSLARRWAVRRLARSLLAEVRGVYERRRRGPVLEEAGRVLATLTRGRYTGVIAPLGEQRLLVETQAGTLRKPLELSRGTREQLYLALRLGLILDYAKRTEPLPVVMDDILVNFDPERARAAASALGGFAERGQILLFTCHPETAERLASHAGAEVARLEPGGIRPG